MKENNIQNNIQFIDNLEFWVSNGKSFIKSYLQPLNFNVIGTRFNKERTRVQYLLLNNIISRDNLEIGFEIENNSYIKDREHQFIIVTSSISSKDIEFHSKHQQHGDFIQNITFYCRDIKAAFNKSIEGGAISVLEPIIEKFNNELDIVERAVIQSPFKDLNHTFINRDIGSLEEKQSNNPLRLFPQFNALNDLDNFNVDSRSLLFKSLNGITGSLDHVATCVKHGEMNHFVQWYHKCLNFKLLSDSVNDGDNLENELILDKNFYVISKKDFKYTKKENIGLKMAVLSNQPSNTQHYKTPPIQFVISEAIEGGEGQIEQFIHYFNGSGVQHLAFNSSDIFKAVDNAKSQKLEFVYIPESYYNKLDERLKHLFPNGIPEELKSSLMKYRILIDSDSEQIINQSNNKDIGYIKQIFTKYISDSPTIFFELIERSNALGFGKGNIIALFESLEKESESKIVLNK
ncbi:hypothetical protein DICPUDRAFT_158589 [Dictyostelium purpureum]|uniref:VOC domain-containing protein n=1 Tax=Dictyostelium purpureum TaxID=5786 RepID=F1A1Z5_DICPU|nr:uncharacterized protein DICPUDRAFT_158589 [Dictyostelium purpureum]EGC29785.1 hypothetical protein DICPUDRAFT_158589 [Dictyostelium purpureum]|eukprot:XP_003293693.1 hypothetical protein DICPUDRAFT_158589 [Dictyostelium purpureum]